VYHTGPINPMMIDPDVDKNSSLIILPNDVFSKGLFRGRIT
jgi:hypothetical protein